MFDQFAGGNPRFAFYDNSNKQLGRNDEVRPALCVVFIVVMLRPAVVKRIEEITALSRYGVPSGHRR